MDNIPAGFLSLRLQLVLGNLLEAGRGHLVVLRDGHGQGVVGLGQVHDHLCEAGQGHGGATLGAQLAWT